MKLKYPDEYDCSRLQFISIRWLLSYIRDEGQDGMKLLLQMP